MPSIVYGQMIGWYRFVRWIHWRPTFLDVMEWNLNCLAIKIFEMKGIAIWLLFSIALAAVSGSDRFECTAEGYKAEKKHYRHLPRKYIRYAKWHFRLSATEILRWGARGRPHPSFRGFPVHLKWGGKTVHRERSHHRRGEGNDRISECGKAVSS